MLEDMWCILICVLVLLILFGIMLWLLLKGNRNQPSIPVQEEYTRQQNKEFVVTCNRCHLLKKNRHILINHREMKYHIW